ncbi:PilZ domain-containing protein [Saccharospirillum salsuginis]|uniref:PilZ domain-containing protein n=1 Tax=Saccharospirillum salsuginis TaxID=418750 RepID=A0A918K0B9_9GAMM|nr:PilZ domain-containing protein [Saccharospirillum salsuginis]GGX41474.1 hypothetical protein GCM10007392_05490 [Saccharospirillum salsuginis]
MRQYIRHPTDIPLHYQVADAPEECHPHLRDVSTGGLSFTADQPFEQGQILTIQIDVTDPPFEISGEVVWCHARDGEYLVGVCFDSVEQAFALRMVEQVCHIEQYRAAVRQLENRELTAEEAAHEWIQRHARDFPAWNPSNDP